MKFTVYQESRLGKRKVNQDRVLYRYTPEALLMVVADGMGGHANGEVAAHVAVEHIAAAFEKEAAPRLKHPFIFLSRILAGAHQAIVDAAHRDKLPEAPRTTCVVCLVQDSAAYWAHSGDSRLYLLRHGEVVTRTRDHSRVQFLIDEGAISEEEAQRHPERNRVLSCLGGERPPQVTCSRKTLLKPDDIIALCTDGAWAPLAAAQFVQALSGPDINATVPALLSIAEAQGGSNADNATLIAVRWESGAAAEAADNEIAGLDEFERNTATESGLSDEEIEAAVAQVRAHMPFQRG